MRAWASDTSPDRVVRKSYHHGRHEAPLAAPPPFFPPHLPNRRISRCGWPADSGPRPPSGLRIGFVATRPRRRPNARWADLLAAPYHGHDERGVAERTPKRREGGE